MTSFGVNTWLGDWTEWAPASSGPGSITRTAGIAAVVLVALSPSCVAGPVTRTAGIAGVSLAGLAPTHVAGAVTKTASIASVSLSGLSPTNVCGAVSRTAGIASVSLAGLSPTCKIGYIRQAGIASVSLVGLSPTKLVGGVSRSAGIASVALAGLAPTCGVGNPKVLIEGPTAIDDTHVYTYLGRDDWNMGTQDITYVGMYADVPTRSLFRFDKTLIPAGTITAFRLWFFQQNDPGANCLSRAYCIKDGNTWVEGILGGGLETGLGCTWNHASHLPGQDWLGGHSGCGVDGVDYDSDPSPPTHDNNGSSGWNYLDLPVAWPTAWRDGARVNNGLVLVPDGFSGGRYVIYCTTDHANPSVRPYFEIEYTTTSPITRQAAIAALQLLGLAPTCEVGEPPPVVGKLTAILRASRATSTLRASHASAILRAQKGSVGQR